MNKAIIIGNGPSLAKVSNSTLGRFPSFGTNGILLKYQPDYYVAVNPLAIRHFWPLIVKCRSRMFLPANTQGVKYTPLVSEHVAQFSLEPQLWIYEGYTVTFVCLQLALWMGYKEVYLLGVDHSYVYGGNPNEQVTLQTDPNHFDPDYFVGATVHNPDLVRSEHAYKLARAAYDKAGGKIINCNPDSKLTVFDFGELPDE